MIDPQISLLWIEIATTAEDDELEAAAAAYALVACVDRHLDKAERRRFGELIPAGGKGQQVREAFVTYCDALLADFNKARNKTLAALEKVSGSQVASDRVLRIAQMAVVADGRIAPEEEAMVQVISAVLGHSPSQEV